MNRVAITVSQLVDMIGRGELRLPEMQRQYVWRAPRVRDLLDSLYRGYPSGSILVWETDKEQPTRELAVSVARRSWRRRPYRWTQLSGRSATSAPFWRRVVPRWGRQ